MTPEELEEEIIENILGPKSVSGDEGTIVQRDIDEQLKLLNIVRQRQSGRPRGLGIRFVKMIPPSAE